MTRKPGRHYYRSIIFVALQLGCIQTPTSGTPSGGSGLSFVGVYPYQSGRMITIQLRVWDGATWHDVGSPAPVGSNNRWTIEGVVVPDMYFTGFCQTATFQAVSSEGSATLFGQDQSCLDALGPSATLDSILTCLTDKVVLYRSAPGVTYTPSGEFRVTTQADADQYQCVGTVNGNLTIVGPTVPTANPEVYRAGVTLKMPYLTAVTGLLTVNGGRAEKIMLPRLHTVGTPGNPATGISITHNIIQTGDASYLHSHLDAPLLTTVGGTITLEAANPDGEHTGGGNFEFGLDGIVTAEYVSANKSSSAQGHLVGLASLHDVTHDVTLASQPWEIDEPRLMPALTAIGGNLMLHPTNQISNVLPMLDHIEGSLEIGVAPGGFCPVAPESAMAHPLTLLTRVGRDIVLHGCGIGAGATAFPALTSVTGTLRLADGFTGGRGARFGNSGTLHLTLGHIDIQGTAINDIPLAADAVVASAGNIVLRNNASLCDCRAAAFVAAQRCLGFAGSVTISDNLSCTGADCTGLPTCP